MKLNENNNNNTGYWPTTILVTK